MLNYYTFVLSYFWVPHKLLAVIYVVYQNALLLRYYVHVDDNMFQKLWNSNSSKLEWLYKFLDDKFLLIFGNSSDCNNLQWCHTNFLQQYDTIFSSINVSTFFNSDTFSLIKLKIS